MNSFRTSSISGCNTIYDSEDYSFNKQQLDCMPQSTHWNSKNMQCEDRIWQVSLFLAFSILKMKKIPINPLIRASPHKRFSTHAIFSESSSENRFHVLWPHMLCSFSLWLHNIIFKFQIQVMKKVTTFWGTINLRFFLFLNRFLCRLWSGKAIIETFLKDESCNSDTLTGWFGFFPWSFDDFRTLTFQEDWWNDL
jgi:hypothetical protein